MFSLICVWINGWVNDRVAGDLRRQQAHYDVIVMRWNIHIFVISNIHTWIDHVASSDYHLKHISRCHIMPHMPCNVSDHLSVICVIKVYISPTKATTCDSFYVGYRPPVYIKWDSPGVKEKYLDYLESKLHDLSLFDGTGNIDSHVEKLNAAMRNAAQCAGCVPRRVFKPKPYWCPELSQLRDRKRFWWTLWVAKQRVLMHGHQGWNVRHGLCHIYMIYVYIWVVYSFCLFCCLFIIVTTQFVALYKPCKPKPKPSTYDPPDNHPLAEIQILILRPEPKQQICHQHANTDHFGK